MQRQARAPETQPFGVEAFEASDGTVLRWLSMAGFLTNSGGITVMIDPLLGGFDMPVMIEFPIVADDVPKLDAVLGTHSDNDHYSVPTCGDLARVTGEYHSTQYVASLMKEQGLPAYGHDIGEQFAIGPVRRRSSWSLAILINFSGPPRAPTPSETWQNWSPNAHLGACTTLG